MPTDTVRLVLRVIGAAVVFQCALVGCGSQQVNVTYDESDWEGTVDTSLAADVQAKQRVLIRLFKAIQEVGFENIGEELADVRFDEPFGDFFGDAVDLHRWGWDGEPHKDRFPVVLTLRKDEPGLPEVEQHRTYHVRKSGSSFVVTRAADD